MRRAPVILVLCLLCGCGGSDAPRPVATVDDGVSAEQAAKPVGEVADPLPTRAALEARPGAELSGCWTAARSPSPTSRAGWRSGPPS